MKKLTTVNVDFGNDLSVKAWRKAKLQQSTDRLVERFLLGATFAVCLIYGSAVLYAIQQLPK